MKRRTHDRDLALTLLAPSVCVRSSLLVPTILCGSETPELCPKHSPNLPPELSTTKNRLPLASWISVYGNNHVKSMQGLAGIVYIRDPLCLAESSTHPSRCQLSNPSGSFSLGAPLKTPPARAPMSLLRSLRRLLRPRIPTSPNTPKP